MQERKTSANSGTLTGNNFQDVLNAENLTTLSRTAHYRKRNKRPNNQGNRAENR